MSETPIDIVISGLQTQISELKEIISGLNNDQNTSSTAQTAQTAQIMKSLCSERILINQGSNEFAQFFLL
ncbi:unnamed protein product [Rhizophagus irregularis]|uniref:DOCKER domain-containing protein n=1 Tax=Rhizophagus irregularis TaxID=588596 RepID=A0A915Z3T4_9GLOM|nr:hypothetical protein GLOIN_2v1777920 [Rhizophagus irregularis DAOM 181602=DAOM 197198]CAB4490440.1 unnamed protein product [Rhizophagus irregularis]CAB5190972.1 unnamed protein product [Rhizophagus irregularis]CAB5360620.1 unnamed protein product [Rhizophagus irregularis]